VQALFRCKYFSGAIIFHVQRFFRCKLFSFEFRAVRVGSAAPEIFFGGAIATPKRVRCATPPAKVKCKKASPGKRFTCKNNSPAKILHLQKCFTRDAVTVSRIRQVRNYVGDTRFGGSRIGCMGARSTGEIKE
jgi:hypothetical protein